MVERSTRPGERTSWCGFVWNSATLRTGWRECRAARVYLGLATTGAGRLKLTAQNFLINLPLAGPARAQGGDLDG
jgi:hypothetical protein